METRTTDKGAFFRMEKINKFYRMGEEQAHILKDIDLTIDEGEYLSVLGPSGSGKSTLMNIIGCLDVATSGNYTLHGKPVEEMTEAELPLIYAGVGPRERRRRARELLERVGLSDRMEHMPNQLSGGQQQRVAIARALAGNPTLLFADEPTGALDQKTGRQVMALFRELNDEGRTIIMITHDMNIARNARRVVHIIDGELTEGGETSDA